MLLFILIIHPQRGGIMSVDEYAIEAVEHIGTTNQGSPVLPNGYGWFRISGCLSTARGAEIYERFSEYPAYAWISGKRRGLKIVKLEFAMRYFESPELSVEVIRSIAQGILDNWPAAMNESTEGILPPSITSFRI